MKRLWIVPFGLVFAAMIWLVIAILPDIKRYMRMHEMYRRGNIQHTPVSAVRLTHSGESWDGVRGDRRGGPAGVGRHR